MFRFGPALVIALLWIAFAISWVLAAGWSAPAERRVGMKGELAYRLVLIMGALVSLSARAWLLRTDETLARHAR